MLVVMALIAILSVFAVVGFSNIQRSSGLTRGGSVLADSIAYARQEAATRNRLVEVRLVAVPDSSMPSGTSRSAFQVWIADADGLTFRPDSKAMRFPDGIEISEVASLSPLLDRTNGITNFAALGTNLSWKGFRIRPDGSLDGSTTGTNFLTLHHFRDTAVPPKNYFTIRLNPVTGRITTHRP
ncbi:hypothetical protein BH09VER1_BH09VER1_46310 [soil metagenome]